MKHLVFRRPLQATCSLFLTFKSSLITLKRTLAVLAVIGILSGCGVVHDVSAAAQATVSPTSVTWGNVALGNAGGPKPVTFTNNSASTITFTSFAFTGTDSGDFAIYQNTCGKSLAPAASCTTTILFKPVSTGVRTAALVFTDSDPTSPQEVSVSGTGTGSVTITPSSLSFGSIAVGSKSSAQTITISNTTSSSVTLSATSFSGTDPGDFSVSSTTCGTSLVASSSCTASVIFSPAATGSRSATFNITENSTALSTSLSGTGSASATGNVSVSPTSVTWGSVAVGNTSGAKSVTLTNTGSSAVSISSIAFTGTNAGDFSIGTNSCGSSLGASSTCTISMYFKPTASGTRTATLTFTDNDASSPQRIAVSGTGTGGSNSGTMSASPTSLSFGTVNQGSTSSAQTITVSNSTSSSATLSSGSITGTNAADFSVQSTNCGASLAASATCTAAIVFKPSTTGSESATWTMTSGSTTLSVSLSGTGSAGGTGSVVPSPTSVTWGAVAVGNTSGAKTVTLTNSGTTSVSISSIAFTGTDASDFSVQSNTCGSSLAASSSCTVSLLFKPILAGTRTATLVFTDSDPSSPQQVPVSGTGTGGSATVVASPTSLTFGSVNVGTSSASQTITVSNGTSGSVTLGTGIISGTNSGDFSISSTNCGSTLAASATCTSTIVFKPAATGTRTGTWSMSISSSSTALSVSLTGTGATAGSGKTSVSPTSLSFGTISNGSSSPAESITISNTTTGTVTLGAGTISGTNASDFSVQSTNCGTSLAASASCTASIVFAPNTTGAITATWTMSVSSSSTALSVALSGTGAAAASGSATLTPTTVNFGSFAVGSPSSTQTVKLYNGASAAIAVNSVTISGTNAGDFAINTNGCRTSNLQPKASCSIGVIFTPTATGTRTATMTFVDTAGNSPQAATLNGTGTASNSATITISPSSLSFGSESVGTTSAAQAFNVAAGGSGSVAFTSSSFGFAGIDPGDFSISSNTCGSSLQAGSSCTVNVTFTPKAIANRVALFSITDNAATPNQVASVSGAGAYSSAQTPAITVDFGSRSGSQVTIPSDILGTEYLESLPTNANRTTVVQGGFTAARYRLEMQNIFTGSSMTDYTASWGALNNDMSKFQAAGVHPLIELEDTPTFLYPSPLRCSVQPETSVPNTPSDWGQLAAQIVAHLDATFPGLVTQYEIWNEPNTAALCSSNQLGDYISIYAAAAPQIKAQAKTDGVTAMVGGPATAGVSGSCSAVGTCTGFSEILTNASTAPYVDFYSYHFYVGTSTSIKDGMTWLPSGTPPSLYSMMMNTSSGVQKRFLEAYSVVKDATTPLGAKTPIFYDEYNDDWAFENDCCRNNATYGPLYNSLVVSQVLDSVYNGAATVPSKMIYFAAAQTTFCILGIVDSATDCSKAVTGAQAQPYPQWYTYNLLFGSSFLDLQDGGHMAASVTLTSTAKSNQLSASAFYTANNDSVIVINPTATSYSGVTLQINNAGLTPSASTLYTMACPLGHNPTNDASCGTNIVSSFPATLITTSGNLQATFDLPSYSVLAITLKK